MLRLFQKTMSQGSALLFLSALTAACSTLFLLSLNYFFGLFTENLWLVFVLPGFGVLCLWTFDQLSSILSTSHLSFESIVDDRAESAKNLGWGSVLLILVSSSLSQLFGASTGREGTAIQYGACLGRAIAKLQMKIFNSQDQDLLVRAGMVAGFSSLFGTPVAALVFLGERFGFKQTSEDSIKWAAVSYLSFYFSEIFKAHHTHYPAWPNMNWDFKVLFSFGVLFLMIFLAAVFYKKIMGFIFHFGYKYFQRSYYRIFFAGSLLAFFTILVGSSKYNGLGVSLIQQSFASISPWYDAILKSVFTLISITSGFKGGEVTPLMSIGASLGSSLSASLDLPLIAASAVGCIFFFAQILGIPLTGAVLMIELFGSSSAPTAFCFGLILWGFKKSKFHHLTL